MNYKEFQGMLFYERVCKEETVSLTCKHLLYGDTMVQSEVNVKFGVYYRF